MPRTIGLVLGGFTLLQFGWICGTLAGTASAEEPTPVTTPTAAPLHDLLCRAFAGAPDRPGVVDTSDRTTEIGQWVAESAAKGWAVHAVDFEVGTKTTGYPQPWLQVCLSR